MTKSSFKPFKTRIKIMAEEVKIALAKAAIGPNK